MQRQVASILFSLLADLASQVDIEFLCKFMCSSDMGVTWYESNIAWNLSLISLVDCKLYKWVLLKKDLLPSDSY